MVKRYPLLEIVAAHGRRAAAAGAAAVALVAVLVLWRAGPGLAALVAALVVPVVYAALRLVAELVEVVADTLMPR